MKQGNFEQPSIEPEKSESAEGAIDSVDAFVNAEKEVVKGLDGVAKEVGDVMVKLSEIAANEAGGEAAQKSGE